MSKNKLLPLSERPYRLGVGLVILNATGDVFVAQRLDSPGAWQMPQGGIEACEDPLATAFREMKEEIGTDNASLIAETKDWVHYDLPEKIANHVWKGRFRGQKQKWFLLSFDGKDDEINIQTKHPEFDEWKWEEFEKLPSLIVEFKRPLYEAIVKEFQPYIDRYRKNI